MHGDGLTGGDKRNLGQAPPQPVPGSDLPPSIQRVESQPLESAFASLSQRL